MDMSWASRVGERDTAGGAGMDAGVTLSRGTHSSIKQGACVMELASYLAGETWSDHPRCVSPVIGAFLRRWNDDLDDTVRQRLLAYAPRILGTATSESDETRRSWLSVDWLVREYAPAWLDLAGFGKHATTMRALPELAEEASMAVGVYIAAASDAARYAARAAASDAARAAASDAAWAAAWAAARAAVRAAARYAALAAAEAAAWAAALAAAEAAAWDAAEAAARAAARAAASDAARNAAVGALALTVALLQEGAFGLLDRMIAVGRTGEGRS